MVEVPPILQMNKSFQRGSVITGVRHRLRGVSAAKDSKIKGRPSHSHFADREREAPAHANRKSHDNDDREPSGSKTPSPVSSL